MYKFASTARVTSSFSLILLLITSSFADRKHADVDDIGNRKINGKVAKVFPNFVSLEKEIQIGAQYAHQIEKSSRLIDDPVVNEYIDSLAQTIVRHSDAKVPFVVRVVDTEEENAFVIHIWAKNAVKPVAINSKRFNIEGLFQNIIHGIKETNVSTKGI